MRLFLIALLLVGGTIAAATVWGDLINWQEGTSPVGFGARWLDAPRVGKPAKIHLTMAGSYGGDGIARIRASPGVSFLSGDTLHRGRAMGASKRWLVTVVVLRPGRFEIRGWLRVLDGETVHELDFVLPFRSETDTAVVEPSRLTRLETVRDGQRYRYGGRFLVPIERPEEVTQAEITLNGVRARVMGSTSVRLSRSHLQASLEVPFVVFVDSRGTLVGSRPLTPISPALQHVVQDSMSKWKFNPAQFRGRTFADWVRVNVRVEPDP